MDVLATRQRLVATNIANADTPGFRTQDIDFATELRAASDPYGDPFGSGVRTKAVEGLVVKNDGNNVSLDREARQLAENSIRFQVTTQLMRDEFRTMRMAIMEGREG